jgi:hypothetical protein
MMDTDPEGLAAVTFVVALLGLLVRLGSAYLTRVDTQMREGVETVLRRRRSCGAAQAPDGGAPQPPSGERAGVEPLAAAPPAPSAPADVDVTCLASAGPRTLVGAVFPRTAASTRLHRGAP